MPLYEYKCHGALKALRSVVDRDKGPECSCGKGMKRLMAIPNVVFKGTGWTSGAIANMKTLDQEEGYKDTENWETI